MVIRTPFEDVELAEASLSAYVLANAGTRGGKPALIDGTTGQAISNRELAAHDVAKGDGLALCSPNCPEFVVAYYAAAGAVITPINPLATGEEVTRQLRRSRARWVITQAADYFASVTRRHEPATRLSPSRPISPPPATPARA